MLFLVALRPNLDRRGAGEPWELAEQGTTGTDFPARKVHASSFLRTGRSIVWIGSCFSPFGTGLVDHTHSFFDEVPMSCAGVELGVSTCQKACEGRAAETDHVAVVVEVGVVDLVALVVHDWGEDVLELRVRQERELGVGGPDRDEGRCRTAERGHLLVMVLVRRRDRLLSALVRNPARAGRVSPRPPDLPLL